MADDCSIRKALEDARKLQDDAITRNTPTEAPGRVTEEETIKTPMGGIKRVGDTPEERGKSVIDQIMKPIRDATEKRNAAIGDEKWPYAKELDTYYVSDAEGSPLSNMMIAMQDDDVAKYLLSMKSDEYATFREEVAQSLGGKAAGDAARMIEKKYKEVNLAEIERKFEALGQLDTIADDVSIMRGEGILSRSDITTLDEWKKAADAGGIPELVKPLDQMNEAEFRAAKAKAEIMGLSSKARRMQGEWDLQKTNKIQDTIKNYDYDMLTKENVRGEYDTLKRNIGVEGADEILQQHAINLATDIEAEKYGQGIIGKVFGTAPTEQENKLITDIIAGKTPTPSDIRSLQNIAKKISPEGWDKLRAPLRMMEGLDPGDQARITKGIQQSQGWSKTKKIVATGGTAVALFGIALPGIIIWSPGQVTNVAEMSDLFKQFSEDKSPSGLLRHFFSDEKVTIGGKTFSPMDITTNFLTGLNEYEKQLEFWYGIPIYGDYIRALTMFGPNHTADGIRSNYAAIYGNMEKMGLITPDDSIIGYRETIDVERNNFYKENTKALFATADIDWINKYGENIYGKTGITTPDGRTQLTSTQAMALYYMMTGKLSYDDAKNAGEMIAANSNNWLGEGLQYAAWRNNVLTPFGEKHDTTSTSQTTIPTEAETWFKSMNGMGLTQEQIDYNTDVLGRSAEPDGKGGWKWVGGHEPDMARAGIAETAIMGGSESTGSLKQDAANQNIRTEVENRGGIDSMGNYADTQAAVKAFTRTDGTPDYKEAQKASKDLSLTKTVEIMGTGGVKTHIKENKDTISGADLRELSGAAKKETGEALREMFTECTGD
jgi:hypothetical protein